VVEIALNLYLLGNDSFKAHGTAPNPDELHFSHISVFFKLQTLTFTQYSWGDNETTKE
jgi:hypothetical protein